MLITAALLVALADSRPRIKATIFGHPLQVDLVKVEKLGKPASASSGGSKDAADVYVISFQEGLEFIPDREIKLHFYTNVGQPLNGLTWQQPAVKFGSLEYSKVVHGHTKGTSCGRGILAAFLSDRSPRGSRSECSSDQNAVKFSAKRLASGKYMGFIDATIKPFNTTVRGQFEFKPTKI